MGRLSLRARATVLGTVVFAVLLTLGSVLLVSTLESRMTATSDQLSRSRVGDLLTLARRGALPATLRNVDENGVAQVVLADGTVVAASPNVMGAPAVAALHPGARAETSTFPAPDDTETETYRFWYASGPSPAGTVTVYAGNSLETVSEASRALRWALGVGVPVVVALLGVAIWLVLGRVIGRLDRIRAEVDRISEENLDARVAGDGVPDEVGRLAATMNAMLERLDTAARRQRDFVADVSHDLQSPLAAQRVALEVALTTPDTVDTVRLRDEVLGATADMERLVGDLLVIASMDASTGPAAVLMDLDSVVLEEAARARVGGAVEVDTSAVSAAPAYADPGDVRRIARNLLENALAHAGSRIELSVEVADVGSGPWAELLIADDGAGVAAEHRDRIFDRFYRADTARPRHGSGLGLSIARELAERNGGTLDLVVTQPGATFRLKLPGSPTAA
ncbi:ATP-binding protein [Nocardioides cavernae]|uniref:sensor histidine kinase n=1 Tax=Nocardioides cavernae TaxID=1921566 RepID=UPI00138F0F64|nr:ATP-binding protein [Nocardioides cavernae]MCK9824423.1 ATP-binding protein [Nocardioides cavernae]